VTAPVPARSARCSTCGTAVTVGQRGPLPRRCAPCRRRPVLPERTGVRVSCVACGGAVSIRGRRGRLPRWCDACDRTRRVARERARRRTGADVGRGPCVAAPIQSVRPGEWAALRPEEA